MKRPRQWFRRQRASMGPFEARSVVVDGNSHPNGVRLEVGVLGQGTPVVMLPGMGGSGTEQFGALGRALDDAGMQGVGVNPRGVGASRGELDGLTLYDLATDVAGVIDHVGGSAHLVGRAFGNRVARMVATSYPGRVRSVVLLAAGGLFAPNRSEPGPEARLRSELRLWRDAARSQHAASRRTDVADWWNGGIAPTLVIQGLDDRAAPPENGRALAAEHPGRVRLVEIERAGHNPMADQPEIVIPQIVAFLQEMEQTSSAGS